MLVTDLLVEVLAHLVEIFAHRVGLLDCFALVANGVEVATRLVVTAPEHKILEFVA